MLNKIDWLAAHSVFCCLPLSPSLFSLSFFPWQLQCLPWQLDAMPHIACSKQLDWVGYGCYCCRSTKLFPGAFFSCHICDSFCHRCCCCYCYCFCWCCSSSSTPAAYTIVCALFELCYFAFIPLDQDVMRLCEVRQASSVATVATVASRRFVSHRILNTQIFVCS